MNDDETRGVFIVTDEPTLTEEADNVGVVALGIVLHAYVLLIDAVPRLTPEAKLAATLIDLLPSLLWLIVIYFVASVLRAPFVMERMSNDVALYNDVPFTVIVIFAPPLLYDVVELLTSFLISKTHFKYDVLLGIE